MRMNMAGAPAGGALPPEKFTGVQAWKPMVPYAETVKRTVVPDTPASMFARGNA